MRQFQADQGLLNDGVAGQRPDALFVLQPALLPTRAAAGCRRPRSMTCPRHSVDVPAVRAVYVVEADGVGFLGWQAKIPL